MYWIILVVKITGTYVIVNTMDKKLKEKKKEAKMWYGKYFII